MNKQYQPSILERFKDFAWTVGIKLGIEKQIDEEIYEALYTRHPKLDLYRGVDDSQYYEDDRRPIPADIHTVNLLNFLNGYIASVRDMQNIKSKYPQTEFGNLKKEFNQNWTDLIEQFTEMKNLAKEKYDSLSDQNVSIHYHQLESSTNGIQKRSCILKQFYIKIMSDAEELEKELALDQN